jgi:flagellar motility protein MotE (MotC chaperone)
MTDNTPKTQRQNIKKKPRKRASRGALIILAFVFILSAGARIVSGTGAAIARELTELSQAGSPTNLPSNASQQCETDETLAFLLDDLRAREALIEGQELELDRKMKAFELARSQISESMLALEQAESRLASTMSVAKDASEGDLAKLTAVYENMKPKEAAALFEQMSPDFAAGFLGRMRSDAAATIMAGLKPETAYSVSVILAGRNANAPSE